MKTINGGTSSICNYYSPPRMRIRLVVDFLLYLARRTVHCYTLLFSYIQLTWLLAIDIILCISIQDFCFNIQSITTIGETSAFGS